MTSISRNAPIGVFDSGVGGLTVARVMFEELPDEDVLYIADQFHVPYGGRPLEEVKSFAKGISRALVRQGCKAIVMACNISSAVALEDVREEFPDYIVEGVIAHGAIASAEATRTGKIGVLATEGTKSTLAYTRHIHSIDPRLEIIEIGCPKFVPLVESGKTESREAVEAAEEYLAPILAAGADVVALGCTHYPFLLDTLQSVAPSIQFIDPAATTVIAVREMLKENALLNGEGRKSVLMTTGPLDRFIEMAPLFLGSSDGKSRFTFAQAEWRSDSSVLAISQDRPVHRGDASPALR